MTQSFDTSQQGPDQSQGRVAYDKLHDAIRAGIHAPGDRLRETDVAERLALSRTLSHGQAVALYEMRVVLERTAAAHLQTSGRHRLMVMRP